MTLGQWANVADLAAAAGVILSVLFLAHEIRQATRETKLANWRQLLDALRDYKAVTNDVGFSELIERGNADYAALTPAEQRSYGLYLEQGIHVIGNFSKHQGTVPKQLQGLDVAVRAMMRDLLEPPGARQWWAATRDRHRFLAQTMVIIDALIRDAEERAATVAESRQP